jgi:lipopolysaccharide transport system ATP-binding protein
VTGKECCPETGKTVISLVDVCFSYSHYSFLRKRRFQALSNVTFDVRQGETLGLIGRNGAGKSTLLKLIGGIMSPDSGIIDNHGTRATLLSLQAGFLPHLTGRENAILNAMLLGWTRSEIDRLMPEIVKFADLDEFIDEPIRFYSSGMRARLGFSVAFLADPDVMLIDEVLGVGDIDFRRKSTEAMKHKIRSSKTVILASHNLATLESLCDRVAWIENGRLMECGDPNKTLREYTAYARLMQRETEPVSAQPL